MGQRILWGLLAVFLIAIAVGRHVRPDAAPAPPPRIGAPLPAPLPPPRQLSLRPNPNATAPEVGTPQIDLLAILAVRRRIEREGKRVFLDALFQATDSIVVRWPDRPTGAYKVVFFPDTMLKGWTPEAVSSATAGLQAWSGNSAGVTLALSTDTSTADIVVHWTPTPAQPNEIGVTDVAWGRDGAITHASISLSLAFDTTRSIDAGQRARAAAHEFGHALGLPHSGDPADLMFARAEQNSPSRRDDATLLLLYTLPPGTIKTP